jgi:peptidoglycan hydrolase CwlO-like protein
MGEDPRATGTAVTGAADPQAIPQASDPDAIRQEIETTREELGDTVAALAAKADVKTQAKQKIEGKKAVLTAKKDELLAKAKEASPQGASSAAAQVSVKARQNPVPTAAAGAFVFGFIAGWAMRR